MKLLAQVRIGWLNLLKHTLNPLTRRMAQVGIGPFAIVRHVGRRSGKSYETPIIMRRVPDGFIIELTYGPDVDWHKNIVASGGCTVLWHRQAFVVDGIEPIDTEAGRAAFSPLQQGVLRLLGRTHFEKMRVRP